jgi:carboxyl-terminal processing protease
MRIRLFVLRFLVSITPMALLTPCGRAQSLTGLEREERQVMLKSIFDDMRKDYYDPTFHGLDWEARFAEAQGRIAKATSKTEANLQIAAFLEPLNDSHTLFIPPQHAVREDYGWQYQMIGDTCYVTRVRPGSDAEGKGLKPGDAVLTINGFTPARESLDKMEYVLHVLDPQTGLHLELRDQSGKIRRVDVMAKQRETPLILGRTDLDNHELQIERERSVYQQRWKYEELGDRLMILKLPSFFQTDLIVNEIIGKARKHGTLVVDLRGNSGGAETTLKALLGGVFEQDVKIADKQQRSKTTPLIAKGTHNKAFTGKLIVLVDSDSKSAAELFARVVQIEKRGTIIGDATSGSVMSARYHPHHWGQNPVKFYGVMVSEADVIMTDSKSLEHAGVTPDEKMLPSKEDLLTGRDPVMAHAAEIAGVALSPQEAAQMFPYEWPKL